MVLAPRSRPDDFGQLERYFCEVEHAQLVRIAMTTLVDGYNLIHASGIVAGNIGPGTLQRARDGLIGFLRASLSEGERASTTVVFDAKDAPPGLSEEQVVDGVRIVYALGYSTADALLEELIVADSAPRQLVVVSSDRQIQQAARRRGATAVDSEGWHAGLLRRRRERIRAATQPPEKPEGPISPGEVDYWLEVFGEDE